MVGEKEVAPKVDKTRFMSREAVFNVPLITEVQKDVKFLYIRDSYIQLYEFMMSDEIYERPNILVTGNPGIGKSVFMVYLYWRLKQSEKRLKYIVLTTTKREESFIDVEGEGVTPFKTLDKLTDFYWDKGIKLER